GGEPGPRSPRPEGLRMALLGCRLEAGMTKKGAGVSSYAPPGLLRTTPPGSDMRVFVFFPILCYPAVVCARLGGSVDVPFRCHRPAISVRHPVTGWRRFRPGMVTSVDEC